MSIFFLWGILTVSVLNLNFIDNTPM